MSSFLNLVTQGRKSPSLMLGFSRGEALLRNLTEVDASAENIVEDES